MMKAELGIKKDPSVGEYMLIWKDNGVTNHQRTYYSDDLEDVKETLISEYHWAWDKGYDITILPSRYTVGLQEQIEQGVE